MEHDMQLVDVVDDEHEWETSHSSHEDNTQDEILVYLDHPRRVIRLPMRYDNYIMSFMPKTSIISAYVALVEEHEHTFYREICESTCSNRW